MAGGVWSDQKKAVLAKKALFGSEVLKDSPEPQPPKKFSLRGVLGLGQSVEINQNANHLQKWGQEFFGKANHLEIENQILLDSRQKELQKNIEELQTEIKKLVKATDSLEKHVENIAATPIVEANEYQLNFLARIRSFIANFRQNISEAGIWLETFAAKRKKRNYFWNTFKNKKTGGTQYMFSDEHGIARSVS